MVIFLNSWNLIIFILGVLGLLVPVLLAVALLTLLERKVLSYMQFRKGPNLVGPLGVLQPIADGLKLFIKENFKPSSANSLFFFLSPLIFFFVALILWAVVPLCVSSLNFNFSLLFVVALSSLSVYAVLGAGWSSNSKYSLLGSVRGVAQMISYEVSLGLILLPMVLLVGGWSMGFFSVPWCFSIWGFVPCFPLFVMWYISSLAETNRSPFDLAEGESELVSGYNVEYAGAPFALFFIGEYANIIIMNLLSVLLFLGGGSPFSNIYFYVIFISVKVVFLVGVFLWVRASFPRVRYDQLMMLMWKGFLPLSIGFLLFYYLFIVFLGGLVSYY
uniref:NADH-ubiquinone oxidoreductase chain 1 n=1 Tax=Ophiotreta durbanensis TaxID=3135534 RepID=A0AAU6PWS9_9ECHI